MHKPKIFLIHFAGGSIYSFQFLKPYLTEFEFIPVELPGRGRRTREALITGFYEAAGDIYRQIGANIHSGAYVIYGHSMGALLTLEIAKCLEKAQKGPAAIIVSGNAGPGTDDGKRRYLLETPAFKQELKEIGGMPDEVMNDDELFNYFIPALKADFEIVEKDEDALVFEKIEAPVYAIMGNREEECHRIANWKNYTSAHFESTIMEGGHFFIYDHPLELAGIIKSSLAKKSSLQR